MGIEYYAWIGAREGERDAKERVDFWKNWQFAAWMERYALGTGLQWIRCPHPGCKLLHRDVHSYFRWPYPSEYPIEMDASLTKWLRHVLEGALPNGHQDSLFDEAITKLDEINEGWPTVRECVQQLLDLEHKWLDEVGQVSNLNPEAYYPDWPDERIHAVRTSRVWLDCA